MEVLFREIKELQFFRIKTELGSVDLMKEKCGMAKCIDSQNGTYLKGQSYKILDIQECVIMDNFTGLVF